MSLLKFIERNWGLPPLSSRSEDRLPNPVASPGDPYVPTDRPAVGDLFDMFNFASAPAAPAAVPKQPAVVTGPQNYHIPALQR